LEGRKKRASREGNKTGLSEAQKGRGGIPARGDGIEGLTLPFYGLLLKEDIIFLEHNAKGV
jgi:hypothetical protein